MSDLVINTTQVTVAAGAQTVPGASGEAIVVGASVYLSPTANRWYNALASGNFSQAGLTDVGVALNSAPGVGQPVSVFTGPGTVNLGATTVKGNTYVVSNNAGKIMPISDVGTNTWVTILGTAIDTLGNLKGIMVATNTQHS